MRQKKKEKTAYTKALSTLCHLFGKDHKGVAMTGRVREIAADFRKETGISNCYVSMSYIFESLSKEVELKDAISVASAVAVTAWSFTKEVYQFDKDLEAALDKTVTADTKVPMDVLCKLPQWCIAVECQSFKDTDGFLAYVDVDPKEGTTLLLMLESTKVLKGKHTMSVFPFKISEGQTIREAVLRMGVDAAVAVKRAKLRDASVLFDEGPAEDAFTELEAELCVAVSRILYIVSDKPDIGGHEPMYSKPYKTRLKGGGTSFLVPKDPKIIKTGFEVAKGIRAFNLVAKSGYSGERGGNAPHIRAAHWHGFWSGKRDSDERTYKVKWLAPIFVNSTEE